MAQFKINQLYPLHFQGLNTTIYLAKPKDRADDQRRGEWNQFKFLAKKLATDPKRSQTQKTSRWVHTSQPVTRCTQEDPENTAE
jgi:hypothetical protein